MTTDLKRLGKRGSYRLGQLRPQGVRVAEPPAPFRPRFARSSRRGPAVAWMLALLLGVAVIAAAAVMGLWFVPFVVGLASGLANRVAGFLTRAALPAVIVMGLAGWGVPLGWQMAHTPGYTALAREIAALDGLPGHASVGLGLTLLVAVAQVVVGYWLGRTLTPRPAD